jgi:hypothetical protein
MTNAVDETLAVLRGELVGSEVEGVQIVDAEASWSTNPDTEDLIVARLTLSNPADDTWDPETTDEIRDRAHEAVARAGVDASSLVVILVPEHPDFGED